MRNLSKSKILSFRQCPKRLWLELHRPELKEDSASTEIAFAIGHQVGALARELYDPKGVGSLIDAQTEGFAPAFKRTADLISTSQSPIFEAGFQSDGALAFADVMLPVEAKGKREWRMVEVKSAASIKDYYHDDIAIQAHIAREAGVPLTSVSIAHIDNTFVYPGGGKYQGLLREEDMTEEAFSRKDEVRQWIADAHSTAAQEEEPVVETGDQCTSPFDCPFCDYCNTGKVFPEYPLSALPRIGNKKKICEDLGIDDLRNVPDELLNEQQQMVKDHTVAGTVHFDAEGATQALAYFGFPARFLDFETAMLPIPIWKGMRPYQHVPFQFSLHTVDEDGKLDHTGFLDLSGNNPARSFTESLIEACGKEGPVYVYSKFEATVIKAMAACYPEFSEELDALRKRLVDLHPIAKDHYYHPTMMGKWGIKAVLPSICPDLTHGDLEGVQDGRAAMDSYREAIHPQTSEARREEIRNQLHEYCKLDTLAMVRIWEFFR